MSKIRDIGRPAVRIHNLHLFQDRYTHGASELKAIINVELEELGLRILGCQLVQYRRTGDWAIRSPVGHNLRGKRVAELESGGPLELAILEAAMPVYWEKLKERQAEQQAAA